MPIMNEPGVDIGIQVRSQVPPDVFHMLQLCAVLSCADTTRVGSGAPAVVYLVWSLLVA